MENKRKCPGCGDEILYKSVVTLNNAIKNNSKCMRCNNSGKNNPFYGKKHKRETIDKFVKSNVKNLSKYKTEDFKKKMSIVTSGKNNPMYGKSFYDVWVEKYGLQIADKKMQDFKLKQSKNNSGENNPMYGKPSPSGSGNGWSGWYKGLFFKSLKELSFIITLESKGVKFESAEKKKFKIKYVDWDNQIKNYFPDFFIAETNTIIEIKPTHFFNSKNVLCKKEYAEKFCSENGFKYEIIDPIRIKDKDIIDMYNSGLLKFIDRYEIKFKEKYLK